MNERDRRELEIEQAEQAWREEYFATDYPSVLAAVKRVLSKEAGDALYKRGDIFDDLMFRIGEDLSQWDYRDALALSGREPFNPYDTSKMKAAE